MNQRSPNDTDALSLKSRIVETFRPFNPKMIILFGSAVHRALNEVEDVDLIIVYDTEKPYMSRLKELNEIWNIPKAVDILAYTSSEFGLMMEESVIVQEALKQGEVIYERI